MFALRLYDVQKSYTYLFEASLQSLHPCIYVLKIFYVRFTLAAFHSVVRRLFAWCIKLQFLTEYIVLIKNAVKVSTIDLSFASF